MIKLEGISKTYKKGKANGSKISFKALEDINFSLKENMTYSIVGESGSGKSTLGKIISGLELHDEGSFCYKDRLVTSKKFFSDKVVRKNIQLVQQDSFSALNPKMSVRECLLEPMTNFSIVTDLEPLLRIKELLSVVELDESVMFKKVSQLSGGQQKRVNLARALSCDPELLILDEATSGLDVVVKRKILDLLKKIQKERECSFLIITHDIDVAMYMSDHISVMKEGKIVEQVTYNNSLTCFKHVYSNVLIESSFLG